MITVILTALHLLFFCVCCSIMFLLCSTDLVSICANKEIYNNNINITLYHSICRHVILLLGCSDNCLTCRISDNGDSTECVECDPFYYKTNDECKGNSTCIAT